MSKRKERFIYSKENRCLNPVKGTTDRMFEPFKKQKQTITGVGGNMYLFKVLNRKSSISLLLALVMMTFVIMLNAQFGGAGAGTEADPYQVANATHLDQVRNFLGNPNVYFEQTAHVDIGGVAQWVAIGTNDNRFQGKYDGAGFEIRNLTRTTSLSNAGFFGYTGTGARLENMHFTGINFYGNSGSGTLIAHAYDTVIRNITMVGVRRMMNSTQGGIVGRTYGTTSIFRSMVDMRFTDHGSGGGAGGLVGWHSATGAITESFALIDMTSTGANNPAASGLVGRLASGSVDNCYAIGIIRSAGTAGQYGALVGYNSGNRPITNSYAIVSYDIAGGIPSGLVYSGAVAQVTESYWNSEITGITTSPGGGAARNTSQMLRQENYVRWDFTDEAIWSMEEGVSFPFLSWEGEEPGDHVVPPAALPPSNLRAQTGDLIVDLTWNTPSVRDPLGYNVYRDGRRINAELVEVAEYRDDTVVEYVRYTYHVTAVYEGDIESERSNQVSVALHAYDGAGTAANPYLIETIVQLNGVRYFLTSHFRLADDINLGVAPWNQGEGWEPVGDNANRFTGGFNGNNFTISGLTINRNAQHQGLFGYTQSNIIQNLNMVDVTITSNQSNLGSIAGGTTSTNFNFCTATNVTINGGSNVGGLVGYPSSGSINDCSVTNLTIAGTSSLGGLAGFLQNIITNRSNASGVITSNSSQLGGIFGYGYGQINDSWSNVDINGSFTTAGGMYGSQNSTNYIRRSYALGNIVSSSATANIFLGGLVGYAGWGLYIEDSYATGNVMSTVAGGVDYVGGLVGGRAGTSHYIRRSFATGNVTGRRYVGGLMGGDGSTNASDANTQYEDCYATGSVTGIQDVGGLIGWMNNKNVLRSYSTGGVSGTTNVGGLIGRRTAGITTASYWNTQTSGQANSPGGGEGMTIARMLQQATFDGWNFENVWSISEDVSYPYLQSQGEDPWTHNVPGPYGLTAALGDDNQSIDLRWEMPGDPNFYRIYRDNERYDTSEETTYNDNVIEEAVWYEYMVTGVFIEEGEERETAFSNLTRFRVMPQFAGGDGTVNDPWQVQSAQVFNMIRENLTAHYIQVDDIDLSVFENWEPIGNSQANSFRGTYDGGEYVISGLTINRPGTSNQGLFGFTVGSVIKNLELTNVNIVGSQYVGAIAGYGGGSFTDCFVTGRIITNGYSGGMIGESYEGSTITRCATDIYFEGPSGQSGGLVGRSRSVINQSFTKGTMIVGNWNGGIVGWSLSANGRVIDSFSTMNITGLCCTAGIFGYNQNPAHQIINSYSIGRIIYTGSTPRGMVGSNAGIITSSYWDTQSSGATTSQGGTGRTTAQMLQQATFINWNFADDGIWKMFAGLSYPTLSWQIDRFGYNIPGPTGMVASGANGAIDLSWNALGGEVVGYNVYVDGVLDNEDELIDGTEYRVSGLTNWQSYSLQVSAVLIIGESQFETLLSGAVRGAPFEIEGEGTQGAPYIVMTAQQLNVVVRLYEGNPNVYFEQGDHIDLAGFAEWEKIGTGDSDAAAFRGKYDGAGFEIRGLRQVGVSAWTNSYTGLFGYTRAGAELRNINIVGMNMRSANNGGGLVSYARDTVIEGCSVTGTFVLWYNTTFGGLVGSTQGTTRITRCWTDVYMEQTNVSTMGNVGGLVGTYSSSGVVSESFALGKVSVAGNTANARIGGLIGNLTNGSVIDCYAMGDVIHTGNLHEIGGLIGYGTRNVNNSYSTGLVVSTGNFVGGLIGNRAGGVITNSYWNLESSGQNESAGGTGRSTLDMLDQDSFVNWDFGGDEERGVWSKDEMSFPYLTYEGEEAPEHALPSPILPPSNLEAEVGVDQDQVLLTWAEPSMRVPLGYHVYRNTVRINAQLVDDLEFTDTNVEGWIWYNYQVTAVYTDDEEQVESPPSGSLRLLIVIFAGGNGTEANPYRIATRQQLDGMQYDLTAHYLQIDDIDLAGINWRPVGHGGGNDSFRGTLDGGGYEIRNMRAEGNTDGTTVFYRGLFGWTGAAVLKNIHIRDMGFGCQHQGGGLVGNAAGTQIENCSATGTLAAQGNFWFGGLVGYATGATNIIRSWTDVAISGSGYAQGGLVGSYQGTGIIDESFALGNISCTSGTANIQLGGLVGQMANGQVRNSYARGDVTSTQNRARVGGLIGENTRPVTNSYSTGRVTSTGTDVGGLIGFNTGAIAESYWDMDTSGIAREGHGLGRRTADMTPPYGLDTYVRWNFEDVWSNDVGDVNNGYPILAYQIEITDLDTPVVTIKKVVIEEVDYARLDWIAVENARSYKIYASANPNLPFEEWDEIDIVDEVYYEDSIVIEENLSMFYRVVASTAVVPDGRGNRRARIDMRGTAR